MKKNTKTMQRVVLSPLCNCLAVAVAATGLTWQSQAAIPLGVVQTFSTQPPVEDWSTFSVSGGAGDITTAAALDSAVQARSIADAFVVLPSVAESGVSQNANARWNSTRQWAQTRPTGNQYTLLRANVINTSGVTLNSVRISFDFAQLNPVPVNENIPGWRVYYSLTGAANSWTVIEELSSYTVNDTTRAMTAVVNIGSWAPNAPLYLLWADDNGPGSTTDPQEGGYSLDNFLIEDPTVRPVEIVRQPVGTNVVKFRPFTLDVQAGGTLPQYQWYKDGASIPGATSPTYSVAQAQLSDSGDYYVVVFNEISSVQSVTVRVNVLDDNIPPTVVSAIGSASFKEITLAFSERMDPAGFQDLVDFQLDPDLFGFVSARLTNNGTVVVLTTSEAAAENTLYTLTLPETVTDLAGNPVTPNQVTFRSWVRSPFGGVVFQVYTNLSTSDNNIAQLTNNVNFPYRPAETYTITNLNTRDAYPDDSHEGYGGRLRALFIPPVSGPYRLFIRSDDSSLLYFNPDGPDPAGRQLVAFESGCCNAFQEPPATQTSSNAYVLEAGKGYYVEALYKEGTGGDYCQVSARLEGLGVPAASLPPLGGSDVGFQAVPPGIVGTVSIAQQPVNVTVEEPGSTTLVVVAQATLGSPFVYQWQKSEDNGATWVDVPNATEPILFLGPLLVAEDNGDQYRVIVRSPGGELVSDPATVTVTDDNSAPCLESAVGSADLTRITVTYSEAVQRDAAEDVITYTVTGPDGNLEILSATIINGPPRPGVPTVVELVTSPRTFGPNYVLTVEPSVIVDLSGRNFVEEPCNSLIVSSIGVLMPAYYPWKYNNLGILGATNLGTAWIAPNYDDSWWSNGHALFIAKNGTPGIPAIPQTNMIAYSQGGATVLANYFRTHFELPAFPSNVVAISLRPILDDGAIFYLNGQEIFAVGMPATRPATYDLLANRTQGNDYNFEGPYRLTGDVLTNLLYGDNVIAVEVHQVLPTSSDVAFALELSVEVLRVEPPRPPAIVVQPVGGTVDEGQPFTFTVRAEGAPPLSYQWYFGDNPIDGATNSSYTIAAATLANQGQYRVVVSNVAGDAPSDPVTLTVIADTVRPVVLSAQGGRMTDATILVTFSKPVNQASAETAANYTLLGPGGLTVVSAVRSTPTTVLLTLSGPRVAYENYQLRVSDVVDTAFTPNVIDPNPTTLPVAALVEVVAINTTEWKYLQQTAPDTPPPCPDGLTWAEPGYNDSGWQTGFGVFYGNRDLSQPAVLDGTAVNTYLNVFTNAGNAIQQTNYYFRAKFTLPTTSTNGARLLLHAMVDDGAAFWINGQRVHAIRMADDPLTCNSHTVGAATGGQTWSPALANPGQVIGLAGLVPGENVLAVQLAQNNGTSSDVTLGVWLNAELLTVTPPAPPLNYTYDAETKTLTLIWSAPGYVLEQADEVTGPWSPVTGATSPWPVSTATGTKFYRLKQ